MSCNEQNRGFLKLGLSCSNDRKNYPMEETLSTVFEVVCDLSAGKNYPKILDLKRRVPPVYLPTFATSLHYRLESVAQKQHFVYSLLKIIKCTIKTVAFLNLLCYRGFKKSISDVIMSRRAIANMNTL